MDEDSDYEIIELNPNCVYESDEDNENDILMEEEHPVVNNNEYNQNENGESIEEQQQHPIDQPAISTTDSFENVASCDTREIKCLSEDSVHSSDSFNNELKPRKKLNLQEYKIHRAKKPIAPIVNDSSVVLELCENVPESLPPIDLPTDPRSIKILMAQQNESKELPQNSGVEKMVEDSENVNAGISYDGELTIHPDYEEIELVSMSCNTDISISPNETNEEFESKSSSKFLTNIVNNFQEPNVKTLLNSSSTLFASISAVLYDKSTNLSSETIKKEEPNEHGENKVIMHLRKDRVRPDRSNSALQTDTTPLFPPLILSPSLIFNRIKNARNFRRRSSRSRSPSRSRSRSRSMSPEQEYYRRSGVHKYTRSLHSTYSSMHSSEIESSSESDSSAYSSARSSDQDLIRKYENNNRLSGTYGQYKNRKQNNPNKFNEERKIIYVGGLTEETTKDELRIKFLKYGTIKKISLHVKEDGSLRYGFVTFAEASVAYEVLDKFSNDPAICTYDLRFGGRRKFCKQSYADLDSLHQENEMDIYNNYQNKSKTNDLSFEDLLNMAKKKLCQPK